MPQWFIHFMGVDAPDGAAYLFWSGFGGFLEGLAALSVIGGVVAWYRKGNCKRGWCWRIGHFPFADPKDGVTRLLCWRHHPDVKHKRLLAEHIHEIQERRRQHLGRSHAASERIGSWPASSTAETRSPPP